MAEADYLIGQKWDSAADVASAFVGGLVAQMPAEPVVVNLDIPVVEQPEAVHWVDNIHPAPKPEGRR